jgi:hypothetical protein
MQLESCILNLNRVLQREPYLYIRIEELGGNYKVGRGATVVFGKLIQERNVNEFIVYRPEHCLVQLPRATRLDHLSVTFLKHDLTPVALNRIVVKKLSKTRDYLKITTKLPHHLTVGDHINISCSHEDQISVDNVEVVDVITPEIVAVENPVNNITTNSGLQFERADVKCTLTFVVA